ncbi:MAG: M48 family metalloprotease [Phycisphaerales bacterium]|nr:M48 family metalloprotease [Phycisphaerales bacterium]
MQVITLLIVALVYLSQDAAGWSPWKPELTDQQRVLWSLAGPAAIVGAAWIAFRLCRRAMERRGSWRAVLLADRLLAACTWLAAAAHAFNVIVLDVVGASRGIIGDWIALDEALAVLPPVLAILGAWWSYYPINRRLREAALIRCLDTGRPIYPIWTRGQYVLSQARLHFGLVLLPAMLIMGWAEAVEFYFRMQGQQPSWMPGGLIAVGTGAIFLFAPTLMTRIWDTTPLAPGDLRSRLEHLCAAHGVGVRGLLVWNTHGGMINGAVMGILGRLRYILLTDALLDTMTTRQVEAVMAHEVGHARRHHLPWLAICLIAILTTTALLTTLAMRGIEPWLDAPPEPVAAQPALQPASDLPRGESLTVVRVLGGRRPAQWLEPLGLVATIVMALGAFGWTSRRFERQADAFAVQHLSGLTRSGGGEAPITAEAAGAMSEALLIVAELNHIPLQRRSWRHGSIQWRRDYLRSLIGKRCDALPIDRHMRWIQLTAALLLLISFAVTWWLDGFG